MFKENKSKEKNCLFFISDYHFEMITLPYINKNIKDDKNVIVVSENNLEDTMNKVISRVNLEKKGKENYIQNINKNIENWIDQENVKIIDCYDINEVQDCVDEIAQKYDNVLVTSGMKKL